MRLLRAKAMTRYLPPNGTAGFARSSVSGNSRLPIPPARTNVTTLGFIFLALRLAVPKTLGGRAQMTYSAETLAMPSARGSGLSDPVDREGSTQEVCGAA